MAWMAKTDEPIAQLATRIPKELHRRLKLHCVTHEIAVQDFVTQAIKTEWANPGLNRLTPSIRSRQAEGVHPVASGNINGPTHDCGLRPQDVIERMTIGIQYRS